MSALASTSSNRYRLRSRHLLRGENGTESMEESSSDLVGRVLMDIHNQMVGRRVSFLRLDFNPNDIFH